MRRLALALASIVLAGTAASRSYAPEPAGYRLDHYRAPVPRTLAGGTVLSTAQAFRLWQEHEAAFVDVLPRPPRPAGLPAGTIWRPKPRSDIPGSLWLADVGYGRLPPAMLAYYKRGLAQATGGDKGRQLVIYCRETCWHSWNAAKRALALGYRRVAWYPAGTDGWSQAGHPLAPASPLPRP